MVPGSSPPGGRNQFNHKHDFIAHSFLLSPSHYPDVAAEDGTRWKRIAVKSSVVPQRPQFPYGKYLRKLFTSFFRTIVSSSLCDIYFPFKTVTSLCKILAKNIYFLLQNTGIYFPLQIVCFPLQNTYSKYSFPLQILLFASLCQMFASL